MRVRKPRLWRIARFAALGLWLVISAAQMAAAQIYQYRRPDGSWLFTDNPNHLPLGAKAVDKADIGAAPAAPQDLAGALKAFVKPRNAIEAAAMATVAIQSGVGLGSGFFISADGLILTNRHVIRTPEQEREQRAAVSERIERQAAVFETRLGEETRRWQEASDELESYRKRLGKASYEQNRRNLDTWLKDLERRRGELRQQLKAFESRIAEEEARARRNDLERAFTVRLADNNQLRAYLVALDDDLDLALLKIDGVKTPFLITAPTGQVTVAQPVYAIGNPAALHNSVSRGIFSGYEAGMIKTDAKIYPGNSGGPLVTETGEVLGINTFKRLTERFEGLGFAIPIRAALQTFARYLPDSKPQ